MEAFAAHTVHEIEWVRVLLVRLAGSDIVHPTTIHELASKLCGTGSNRQNRTSINAIPRQAYAVPLPGSLLLPPPCRRS